MFFPGGSSVCLIKTVFFCCICQLCVYCQQAGSDAVRSHSGSLNIKRNVNTNAWWQKMKRRLLDSFGLNMQSDQQLNQTLCVTSFIRDGRELQLPSILIKEIHKSEENNTFVRNVFLSDHLNQLKTLQITDILFCIGGLIRKEIMAEITNWTSSKRINISCSPSKGTMITIIIYCSVRRCYLESQSD